MEYKGFKYTVRVCPDSIYVSIDRESVSSLHLPVKATQDGWVVPGIGSQRPLLRLEYTMTMPPKGSVRPGHIEQYPQIVGTTSRQLLESTGW